MRVIFFLLMLPCLLACNPFVTKYDRTELQATLENDEPVHLNNSLEWWYTTGHLTAEDGREFGIEYVFFHFTTREFNSSNYMVNFAVTDPQTKSFYYDYAYFKSKETPEAGVLPLDLNRGNYSFSGQKGTYSLQGKMDPENIGIALKTVPAKEPVFQNGTGYEQYGDISTAGYYSYPRLDATGYLIILGDTVKVSGQLWYDRQWNCGTNLIGGGTGWDWISVQFQNTNEDLMVYRVEDRKLKKELHGGSFHREDGTVVFLDDGELEMKPLTYWTSPDTKRKYPVSWQVTIPKLEVDVKVEAVFPQQELILTRMGFRFPYWEGMCKVTGTIAGERREGNAYLEMTNRPKER